MSTVCDSRLYLNFWVKDGGDVFQDCIDFLEREGEPNYLQQTESSLKLYGSLSGGFHYYENQLTTPKGSIENIFFNTPCDNYTSPDDDADRLTTLLGFVSRLYQAITPVYVYGIHNWRVKGWQEGRPEYKIPEPISDEGLANNRIDHPTWLMLFPPEMVEEYGREWVLDLPAEHTEELDDGAIMVVATRAFPECETDMETVKLIDDAVTPLEEAFQTRDL